MNFFLLLRFCLLMLYTSCQCTVTVESVKNQVIYMNVPDEGILYVHYINGH